MAWTKETELTNVPKPTWGNALFDTPLRQLEHADYHSRLYWEFVAKEIEEWNTNSWPTLPEEGGCDA